MNDVTTIDISAFTIRAYQTADPVEPKLAWVAHAWTTRHGFQMKSLRLVMLPATAFGETEADAIANLSLFLAYEVRKEEERAARYARISENMRANNPRAAK